jgi:DNA helicase-2/ATP-dependent DNA helicase PcrA
MTASARRAAPRLIDKWLALAHFDRSDSGSARSRDHSTPGRQQALSDPFALDDEAIAAAPRPGGLAARAMAAAAPAARYLAGLNPEQTEAVQSLDGPVLVLAGAGTGKTRVLTTRIAHIIATGRAYPSQILSVTFTNKAAREMKERIGHLIGGVAEGMPWLGTFHSIGTKMLRRHAELVDLRPDFTILDTDDQIRLLKQLLQAENIDEKRWPARVLASVIDGWKNRGLRPDKVPAGEAEAFAFGRGRQLYKDYQARLKTLNACDFGDLLMESIRLLQENPEVLAQFQDRFRYILVDEYQDTNVAQYLWLRLLAQRPATASQTADASGSPAQRPRQNVCCVGDDDQSIYGWRGAEVDNILRFEKDFPGAKVIRLERNYRSTGHILATASHLIAHNEGRLGKTLFTDGDAGDKVTVSGSWDSEEEARQIGEEIEALQHKGQNLNEVAILVRASFQMREFEERFITLGLPYRVIGGPRFYERKEIRDALAYLRIVHQPADDLAFERIVNVPKRGLGDAAVNELHAYARANGMPLTAAVRALIETEEFKPKVRQTLRDLATCFDRWAGEFQTKRHSEVAETILEESGYIDMLKADRSADAAGRLDNLKELIRSMEEFENLQGFLEHVSLVMEAAEGDSAEKVTLMTLHAAKGLEFETVFLPGWEEGLFPHPRALDEQGRAGLEEERRLAYVGVTRAKLRAKIWFASNRRIHGSWNASIPSRFVDELPEAHVEVTIASSSFAHGRGGYLGGSGGSYGQSRFDRAQPFAASTYSTPGWQRAQTRGTGFDAGPQQTYRAGGSPTSRQPKQIEGELIAKSSAAASRYGIGARVFHVKFGPGAVAAVDGNKLTVDFDKAGRKMVLESYLEAG